MKPLLNAHINGIAPISSAIAGFGLVAPFAPVAVAAGLMAAIRLGRRIDGTLGYRRIGLGKDGNSCLGHFLRGSAGRDRRWQRRNLHKNHLRVFPGGLAQLLRIQNEEIINHSVIYYGLEESLKGSNECKILISKGQGAGP